MEEATKCVHEQPRRPTVTAEKVPRGTQMPVMAQTRRRVQVAVIEDMRPESVVVETELFSRGALEFYTAKNMGWDYTKEQWDTRGS